MNKNLSNASSYSYTTSNERGHREVTIEYRPTILERIFKKEGKEFVFVTKKSGILWFHKDTMEEVDSDWYDIIDLVVRLCNYHDGVK